VWDPGWGPGTVKDIAVAVQGKPTKLESPEGGVHSPVGCFLPGQAGEGPWDSVLPVHSFSVNLNLCG
jgi:hypothetical protein